MIWTVQINISNWNNYETSFITKLIHLVERKRAAGYSLRYGCISTLHLYIVTWSRWKPIFCRLFMIYKNLYSWHIIRAICSCLPFRLVSSTVFFEFMSKLCGPVRRNIVYKNNYNIFKIVRNFSFWKILRSANILKDISL